MTNTLNGGLQGVFGAAFGSIYLDGTLHHRPEQFATNGDRIMDAVEVQCPIKLHRDEAKEAMLRAAGYTDEFAVFVVLQKGVEFTPATSDEITAYGRRWSIEEVGEDGARTHWIVRSQANG